MCVRACVRACVGACVCVCVFLSLAAGKHKASPLFDELEKVFKLPNDALCVFAFCHLLQDSILKRLLCLMNLKRQFLCLNYPTMLCVCVSSFRLAA